MVSNSLYDSILRRVQDDALAFHPHSFIIASHQCRLLLLMVVAMRCPQNLREYEEGRQSTNGNDKLIYYVKKLSLNILNYCTAKPLS